MQKELKALVALLPDHAPKEFAPDLKRALEACERQKIPVIASDIHEKLGEFREAARYAKEAGNLTRAAELIKKADKTAPELVAKVRQDTLGKSLVKHLRLRPRFSKTVQAQFHLLCQGFNRNDSGSRIGIDSACQISTLMVMNSKDRVASVHFSKALGGGVVGQSVDKDWDEILRDFNDSRVAQRTACE